MDQFRKLEIIAFASGKGGTGKTSLMVALGYALQKAGFRVLYIDTDLATDGLSLYLLGPEGMNTVRNKNNFTEANTFEGYLRSADLSETNWAPKYVSRPDHGGPEWGYDLLMSSLHLYGDDESSLDPFSTSMPRAEYRKVIQRLFTNIRGRGKWDYVLIDTRGGFSPDAVEVCALAESFILVTEPNPTNIYQDRNLFGHISNVAKLTNLRPALRGVFVNKVEAPVEEYFKLLQRAYDIHSEDIFAIPIDAEEIRIYQQQLAIYESAPASQFSVITLRAFASMFGVVTAAWSKDQITAWQTLVQKVNRAVKQRKAQARLKLLRQAVALTALIAIAFSFLIYQWLRTTKTEESLNTALQRLAASEGRLEQMRGQLKSSDEVLSTASKKFEDIVNENEALKGQLEGAKRESASLTAEVQSLKGKVSPLTSRSKELLTVYKHHSAPVLSAQFSPDGQQILSAGNDSTIQLWSPTSEETGTVFKGHVGPVLSASFSRDGKRIITASTDKTAKVWNTNSPAQPIFTATFEGAVNCAEFSPDGAFFAAGGDDRKLRTWRTDTFRAVASVPHSGPIRDLAFHPFTGFLMQTIFVSCADNDVQARCWQSAALKSLIDRPINGNHPVQHVLFSATEFFLTAAKDGTVSAWDAWAAGREPIWSVKAHEGEINAIALDGGGSLIATAGKDGSVKVWNRWTNEPQAIFNPKSAEGLDVKFSVDSRYVAVAGSDGVARIVDCKTGKEKEALKGHDGPIHMLNFSPTGRFLVTAGEDAVVRVWAPTTTEP